jgi:hypothetical protein
MPLARVVPALVVGLLGAAALGPRLDPDPDRPPDTDAGLHPREGCAIVDATAWSPLPGLAFTGALAVHLPAGAGALVLIVGDRIRLDVSAETSSGSPVLMHVEQLQAGAGTQAPPAYWIEHGDPWAAPRAVLRATVDASPRYGRYFRLRLGRRAPRVLARLFDMPHRSRAQVCAAEPGGRAAFGAASTTAIGGGDDDYFGTGWYGAGQVDGQLMRWMSPTGAMLVPFERRGDVTVALDALLPVEALARGSGSVLRLTVNDAFHAAEVAMRAGRQRYEWTIPARAWVTGTNELLFSVSPATRRVADGRDIGFALHRLELTLRDEAAARLDR